MSSIPSPSLSPSSLSPASISWLQSQGEDPFARADENMFRVRGTSLRGRGSDNSKEVYDFPMDLQSVEALEYCGLSSSFASFLTNACHPFDNQEPSNLLDYIRLNTIEAHHLPDACSLDPDSKWCEVLSSLPIAPTLISGIMDPSFTTIRHTQTAKAWAHSIVTQIWKFISSVDRIILEQRRRDLGFGPKRRNIHHSLPVEKEHEVLYMGGPLAHLMQAVKLDHINLYGGMNLEALAIHAGDFNSWKSALYLTPQYQTALQYALYASRASNYSMPVCLLKFSIPSSLLEGKDSVAHFSKPEYKHFIEGCRSRTLNRGVEKRVEKIPVLEGYICGSSYRMRYPFPGFGERGFEPVPLRWEDGTLAIQMAFNRERYREMEESCVDKIEVMDVGDRKLGLWAELWESGFQLPVRPKRAGGKAIIPFPKRQRVKV